MRNLYPVVILEKKMPNTIKGTDAISKISMILS